MEKKVLSERAKQRLRIAAGFLRSSGYKLDFPRNQFYEEIQEMLNNLTPEYQSTLKELVDWVEQYDNVSKIYNDSIVTRSKK